MTDDISLRIDEIEDEWKTFLDENTNEFGHTEEDWDIAMGIMEIGFEG